MTKVLFVCLGNICRSPMAEGLMKKYTAIHELPITVASAGTSSWEKGNPPHRRTQAILQREGIDSSGMFSRQIQPNDFYEYDWLIAMDQTNVETLRAHAPAGTEQKIHLYLEAIKGKESQAVPDPWYTGDFEETFALLSEGVPFWAKRFHSQS